MNSCFKIMKNSFQLLIIIGFIIIFDVSGYADGIHPGGIKSDGTIGEAGQLELHGPNYEIKAEFGRQSGANLFHSFQQFNVHKGESATFSGPDSVQNIISRVTGGSASWIDGLLRSVIPGADFYLLNPAGVMFGANASLDLGGSFHVSTADYLRMGEDEKFFSQPLENEVLSVAPPSAFGFLNNHPAPITIEGRGEITEQEWNDNPTGLKVSEGKTISLIGGDIEIREGAYYRTPVKDEKGNYVNDKFYELITGKYHPNLFAPGGRINLASVSSRGEVTPSDSDLGVSSSEKGNITFSDHALIDVSSEGSGSVFIRGGNFLSDSGHIFAQTHGKQNGGAVDIQADNVTMSHEASIRCESEGSGKASDIRIRAADSVAISNVQPSDIGTVLSTVSLSGDTGNILIEANAISFTDRSWITAFNMSDGKNANVTLKAEESVSFAGGSSISVRNFGANNGGTLLIDADNISFSGSNIFMPNNGTGKGSSVKLTAKDTVSFSGKNMDGSACRIFAGSMGTGDGGTFQIEAENISLADGIFISGGSVGKGRATNVFFRAADSFTFTADKNLTNFNFIGVGSYFQEEGAGDGGELLIEAKNISITDGAWLRAETAGRGSGGNIILKASDSISFSGRDSKETGARVYLPTTFGGTGAGDAGSLVIEAGSISFSDGAFVNADSLGPGKGGSLSLRAEEQISLTGRGRNEGKVVGTLSAGSGKTGTGSGGTISVESKEIRIADGGEISSATAGSGKGGEITVTGQAISVKGSDSEGNVSRIYAGSDSSAFDAGAGGNITVSAQTLVLSDKGKIDTTAAGSGKAGDIRITAGEILMGTDSSISSGSGAVNVYPYSDLAERDQKTLIMGDVVKVANAGGGKSESYVNTDTLVRYHPVFRVANLAERDKLSSQHKLIAGDMAEVADAGDGLPARFVYANYTDRTLESWVRFDNTRIAAVQENMAFMDQINRAEVIPPDNPTHTINIPFEQGDVIRVNDTGNGKPGNFIFTYIPTGWGAWWCEVIRIPRFESPDISSLNALNSRYSFKEGDIAKVGDAGSMTAPEFVFHNNEWSKINTVHQVADTAAISSLVKPQTGNVAKVSDTGNGIAGSFVYSGKEWKPLSNTRVAENLAARDALSAAAGDVVYVSNADGFGNPENFVYADGKWQPFAKGDASLISIQAANLMMSGNSRITTSAEGHGNAANINLEVGNLTMDSGSFIGSKSGSEMFGGSAGNITVAKTLETDEHGSVTNILQPAETVTLTNGGSLTTEANDAAGGDITIRVKEQFYFDKGTVTTKVYGGDGKGGDVKIRDARLVIMNPGEIVADAKEGRGGNIHMATDHLIKSPDSIISASSELGIDGEINIESVKTDVTSGMISLPSNPLDAARWLSTPCAQRTSEDISRFVMTRRDGAPVRNQGFTHMSGELGNAVSLAYSYSSHGYYQKAMSVLNKVMPVAETSEDYSEKTLFFAALSQHCLYVGNKKDAIRYVKIGLEEADKSGDSLIKAEVLNILGSVRAANRDYPGALKAYRDAAELIDESEQGVSLKAVALLNQAQSELQIGEYRKALLTTEQAVALIEKQPDSIDKAENLIAASRISKEETSKNWLQQAAKIGETVGNPFTASCAYGYLGQHLEHQRQYADALSATRKAVFYANLGDFPEILYRWQWRMGRLFREQNDMPNAVAAYQEAVATLNPIRMEFLTGTDRERIFETDIKPVYRELAQLLLEETDKSPDQSQRLNLMTQAVKTVEMLKKAELQDFYHDECMEDRSMKPSDADQQIPLHTAVMYPISMPDYLSLLILFPDGMDHIRVPVSSEQLEETAKRFREKMETFSGNFLDEAKQMYDWLIRPVENKLNEQKTDTLVIIPDGVLTLVPFSALYSGKGFLIEEYALATIPTLTLTDIRQTASVPGQILINGLSEARQGFLPLSNVKNEVQAISSVFRGKVLLDQEFTVENLEAENRNHDYNMIHMATHAVFGKGTEDTYLLTYKEILMMDELDRLVGLKKYQDRPLELITLSACQTAAGDERSAFGLAGVAIRAGARSALASLWKVDDNATSLLIGQFYRELGSRDMTKAKALQNAQKKLISHKSFEHPVFWAPFLLIGNWM